MSNGRGNVVVPGQMGLRSQWQPGFPTAQPISVTINTPTGIEMVAFGGLSKLEEVASRVACAIIADEGAETVTSPQFRKWADRVAIQATSIAEAVLAEAHRATAEGMKPPQE